MITGLAAMLILGGAVFAQDAATPTAPVEGEMPAEPLAPVEGEVIEGPTLESVTADPGAVYGQEVTLEGVLAEFVNVRTFVLSEGAALDDDKVLVINNTPIEFDPSLVTGERVQITGIVMPSYNEGGFDQVISNFMDVIAPAQSPVESQPPADTTTMDATPADAAADDASSADTAETPAAAIPGAADTAADATPAEGAMDDTAADATPADATTGDTGEVNATDAQATLTNDADAQATPADATTDNTGAVDAAATPIVPADTTAQTPGMSFDNVDWTPLTNAIAERYPEFTIVEITSIDSVMFIPPAE
jgi:hypothetical protein